VITRPVQRLLSLIFLVAEARGAAKTSFGVAGGVLILLVQNITYWGRSKVEGINSSEDFFPRNLDLVLSNNKERSERGGSIVVGRRISVKEIEIQR